MEQELTLDDIPKLAATDGFWYLGSPYSKYPGGHLRAATIIERIAGELVKKGVRLFCPIAHSHAIAMSSGIDPFCHKTWMFQDEAIFPWACGLIATKMQSWDTSTGLTQERRDFLGLGKPVWHLDPAILGFVGV